MSHDFSLYHGEFLPKEDISLDLRSLSKSFPDKEKMMIVRAREVLQDPSTIKEGTCALYMSLTRELDAVGKK